MALADLDPDQWLKRLLNAHEKVLPDLRLMDAYYEGIQPMAYLAPELLLELQDRLRQVVINWPQLVVDALDERLDVEGFRYASAETAEEDLWSVWQASNMDEGAQQTHVDSLALRRSYVIVGPDEDDESTPIITAESALEVISERDPRTRREVAAVKRWEDPPVDDRSSPTKCAMLYLPNSRIQYEHRDGQWKAIDRDEHNLGQLTVVSFPNRPRLRHLDGTSELRSVIPLSDAACKVASDMMVSAEFHAMPRRWATGLSRDDFADENGQPLGALSTVAGKLWANESENVKYGQFPEAQLTNFHETINLLARLVASLTGLPPAYLGLATDQPPSADAIRASEARLVKRAERRQRSFGESWERVMRLVLLIRDGEVDPRARSLETVWRDPATPTYAQKSDAVTKLYSTGLLPEEQAWEDLGYSAVQRARMRAMQDERLTRMTALDMHSLATAPDDHQAQHTPPAAPAPPTPAAARAAAAGAGG